MSQRKVECAKCGRIRSEKYMEIIRTHGVTFALCAARTTCRLKARTKT